MGYGWLGSDEETGLFICSNPGTGKTRLALCLLQGFIDSGGNSFYYIESSDLHKEMIKESLHEPNEMAEIRKAYFLVIDDVGYYEGKREFYADQLRKLLNFTGGRKVIVVSNYSLFPKFKSDKALDGFVFPRENKTPHKVISRIGAFQCLSWQGVDMRGREK
jgi:DNA replication protein DnaC